MKKFLLIFVLLIGFATSCFSQVQWYRSTSFAIASVYNGRYSWGDWQSSNVNIKFDIDNDLITIYSPTTQYYKVYSTYNNGNTYYDNSGGRQVKFYVYDQDYDRGTIRLRVETNGNSQLYVDFNDVAWVYNVKRTR